MNRQNSCVLISSPPIRVLPQCNSLRSSECQGSLYSAQQKSLLTPQVARRKGKSLCEAPSQENAFSHRTWNEIMYLFLYLMQANYFHTMESCSCSLLQRADAEFSFDRAQPLPEFTCIYLTFNNLHGSPSFGPAAHSSLELAHSGDCAQRSPSASAPRNGLPLHVRHPAQRADRSLSPL
jgi:hypothetical protein